jgi:hypothetical protein
MINALKLFQAVKTWDDFEYCLLRLARGMIKLLICVFSTKVLYIILARMPATTSSRSAFGSNSAGTSRQDLEEEQMNFEDLALHTLQALV